MKTVSSELAAHLLGELLTLSTVWIVTRRDGEVMGFTDHDVDLVVEGVTCKALTGYTRSAIQTGSQLNVDSLDLEGVLDDAGISEEDLISGRFDGAEIRILTVNWADLSQGVLKERKGWLGEVLIRQGIYVADLRGLSQALTRQIIEVTTPDCRADLFDSRCRVNAASFTVEGTVTSADGQSILRDSSRTEADDWFTYGEVTFLTGPNAGVSREVKAYAQSDGGFELWLPLPAVIEVGETYRARAGCDKTLQTCISKFDNVLNFRGEPFIPGVDFAINYPDAKASTTSS